MKLEILELTDESIKFALTNTTIAFANSLRRVLLSEIPTVTIDLVEILRNNTVLPDEMLSHRLGMIPLYTIGHPLKYSRDCTCTTHCPDCSAVLELDVSNMDDETMLVTSGHLFLEEENVAIRNRDIVIAKLSRNQSVAARCIARRGTAKMHAKWSPVTVVEYEYDPENIKRDTTMWYENDIEKEWPGVKEGEADLIKTIDRVEMKVEVVEGCADPIPILLEALNILKSKISKLIHFIETVE
ncbi:DNA-directed RNA polymerase II subunit RPB3 [Astathelohania contejeani]|uniref:DNA-directed RNA polymerase II subunit RPB3 n=1 Tax=Astathelohania contejeani TaxID=164912 RepID=A0ABQ7I0I1_9MICR|nr:DNA-directed RNA polymerase II subunit RPB3 [Thelohania contejeani]